MDPIKKLMWGSRLGKILRGLRSFGSHFLAWIIAACLIVGLVNFVGWITELALHHLFR